MTFKTAFISLFLSLLVTTNIYAQEPTEHVTGLTTTVLSDQSIQVGWTVAGGATVPTNYLIVAYQTTGGTPITVADGDNTPLTDDTDFTGAAFSGQLNVAHPAATVTFTTLLPETPYTFVVYSYTTGGTPDPDFKTNTPPSTTATTWASAATTQVTAFTATPSSATSIDLSWTVGDGSHTIIIAKEGGATNADPANGTAYTANSTFGSGNEIGTGNFVVFNDANATAQPITITGLTTGTIYHFTAYTYNYNSGVSSTENYFTPGATASATPPAVANTSTLTLTGTPNASVSSVANTSGTAVEVMKFIVDDIASDDTENMVISAMTFTQGTGNGISNWDEVIAGAVLTDGTNTINLTAGVDGNITVNSTSLAISSIPAALGTIAADGNKTFTLKVWLKTNLSGTQNYPTTIDGQDFVFELNANTNITVSGSQFAGSQTIATANNDNVVDVTATKIRVTTQPSASVIRTQPLPQQPAFEATDANNNRDLGFNSNLTSVNTTSPDNLGSNSTPATFASGVIDFTASGFNFPNLGSSTMTVTAGGITSAATNSITVIQNVEITNNSPSNLDTSPLPGGEPNVGVLGFIVQTDVGGTTTTLNGFTITSDVTPLDKFTNPRIYKSSNSTLSTGDTDLSATISETVSGYAVSGLNVSISSSNTYLFLMVDVLGSVDGATTSITLTLDPSTFVFSTPDAESFSNSWDSFTYAFEDISSPEIVTLNPVNGALAVPVNSNLVLTFTEAVKKTTSNTPRVKIFENGVGTPVFNYVAKTASELTLSSGDTKLTINPATDLDPNTEYYVTIDDGAFLDLQDNNFTGIDNSTVFWAFKTYGPPLITAFNPQSCVNNDITITGENFSDYPGDVNGVTKVEFARSGGGVTTGTVAFVSDTEITVTVPSNAVTGPVAVYKGADVSSSTTEAIPDIILDFTIGLTAGDLSVCSEETKLVYEVDTEVVNYADFTYDWTLSSNIKPVIQADVNAVLVDIGTNSGASTISVTKTRDSDGCVTAPYTFNVTVHPKPTVVFDPVTSHSNLNQNGYTLILEDGGSNPISNGKEPIFPFVTFSGNGVTKELADPDDVFKFNSLNLAIGDHEVGYYYMDANECEITGAQTFNVYDGQSTIGGLNPDYCDYDITAYTLTPAMEGGSVLNNMEILELNGTVHASGTGWGLNGNNLSGYSFTPSEAATHLGTNQFLTLNFRYTYTTPALQVITKENIYTTIYVRPDADFEFTVGENAITRSSNLIDLDICENSETLGLTPTSKVDAILGTVEFTSDNAGNPITVDVFDPSQVTFNDPNRVLPETVNVTFTYSEEMGTGSATCSNFKTLPIYAYPQPAVPTVQELNGGPFIDDPQVPGDPLICVTSVVPTAEIIDKHTIDGLTTVEWYTNEEGTGTPASILDSYKADINTLSEGDENYRYLFQTYDKFCRSDRLRLNYEYFPNLDFTTSSNILTIDPVLTSEFGSITPQTYTWDVESLTDGTIIPVSQVQNPQVSGLGNDIYQVSLTLESTNGCTATLPKNIMFFTPVVPNTTENTYQFKFSEGDQDWFSVTDDRNGDLFKKLSGGNLWVHSNNTFGNTQYNTQTPDTTVYWSTVYNNLSELPADTAGFLVSPSLDLSNYLRPMVSFNCHFTLEDEDDGVVLQFTNETLIDEDTEWITVGEVNSGVNWYNLDGIVTQPGNQLVNVYGWSNISSYDMDSTMGGWVNSKHQLGTVGITDYSNVIFRFALATDEKPELNNGFALYDFFIGNRTRTVLVENFANSGGGTVVNSENTQLYTFAESVNNEIQDNNTDILLLNYRTPFPEVFDEFYQQNAADHGVRTDFYNVTSVPRSRIDGYERLKDLPWSDWGETEYNVRSLELAQMDIDINYAINLNGTNAKSMTITADLTPKIDIPPNAVAMIAIVDRVLGPPAYSVTPNSGEESIQNLVRKILPNGAGHRFPNGLLEIDGTQQISYTYHFEQDIDKNNLAIIVFVQDFSEGGIKEVYQSEILLIDGNDIGTITAVSEALQGNMNLYPSPADQSTTLVLNEPVQYNSNVRLFDIMGNAVLVNKLNAGETMMEINTNRLASGVYIVQVENESGVVALKRFSVSH